MRVNERITVDGREITDRDFARAVRARARRGRAARAPRRARRAPDLLRGADRRRLRALPRTRAWTWRCSRWASADGSTRRTSSEPLASAIVSIDLDHEVYLGRTLAAIAREKAGVLRAGRATVIGPLARRGARARSAAQARALGARVIEARRGARVALVRSERRLTADRASRSRRPRPATATSRRCRAPTSATTCWWRSACSRRRSAPGSRSTCARVPAAVAGTRWPGRLQRIPGDPALLLDGAHNPAGARALAAHLAAGPPFVLRLRRDGRQGRPRPGARALSARERRSCSRTPRVSRAASPAALARRAGRLARGAHREPSVARALALARRLARAHGPGTEVVVAGSLYLVGAVLALLGRERGRA